VAVWANSIVTKQTSLVQRINANRTLYQDLVAVAIERKTRRNEHRPAGSIFDRHGESIDDTRSVQEAVVKPAFLNLVILLRLEVFGGQQLSIEKSQSFHSDRHFPRGTLSHGLGLCGLFGA